MQSAQTFASRMNSSMDAKSRILEFIPNGKQTILDFGCGSGLLGIEYAKAHPQARITLIEQNDDMLSIAKGNANGINNIACYQTIPKGALYDVILLSSVIHEILDNQIFTYFKNHLAPHGLIIIRDGFKPDTNTIQQLRIRNTSHFENFLNYASTLKTPNFVDQIIRQLDYHNDVITADEFVIKSMVNKYTWGTQSLYREAYESFLCLNKPLLMDYAQQAKLNLIRFETFVDSDYFTHLDKLVEIVEMWETHFYAILTHGS